MDDILVEKPLVKLRRPNESTANNLGVPRGLIWDHINYSCAYDTLFTVLYNIWAENPTTWSHRFNDISDYMCILSDGFMDVMADKTSLEAARDTVHAKLRESNPNDFPVGPRNLYIDLISSRLLGSKICGHSFLYCPSCGYQGTQFQDIGEYMELLNTGQFHNNNVEVGYIAQTLGWQLTEQQRRSTILCSNCSTPNRRCQLMLNCSLNRMLYIMCMLLTKPNFYINKTLTYTPDGDAEMVFNLRGVVYLGSEHFISHVIGTDGAIWFHDGIATHSTCIREGHLNNLPDDNWL